ncbi:MAG: hypothetical protein GY928_14060 [Colwellia sp.]|nr:hypothetical protein [Colwellia sp.]
MKDFKKDIAYQDLADKLLDLKKLTGLENESGTRLRAIDTIFFDILHWNKNSVETEKYCRHEGYADYVFLLDNKPCLVLEAKKSGIEFMISGQSFSDRPYNFGLFAKECPDAFKAFQQAIGYAATLGARYVAISNGHQWLFTLTFIENQSIEKRLIYVFESFDAILERFSLFCECFTPNGLSHNEVRKYLLDTLRQPAPAKLSTKIPGYPLPATRNVFQNEITYILDYVWQAMSKDEETVNFVENCYVNPNSHEDIISLVKELIEKRRNEDDLISEYDVQSIDKLLPQQIANLPSERPFIVLGEVGRGKSSFLKYLRFVAAKEALKNYIQIEINFLDRPDSADEIPNFVYNEVERQLRENYKIDVNENKTVRGVLNNEIRLLKKTPKGVHYSGDEHAYRKIELDEIEKIVSDKHHYLGKVIRHLKKGRQRSVALFFDNLDRRQTELQENAFLKASAIARDWVSLVFICLRPSTYYSSQRDGVMDTIAPITFTVGHPDLSLVLKKRFAYAKRISEGETLDKYLIRSTPSKNTSFYLPKVATIFGSCEFSAWKRRGIIPLLTDVSNGNIRKLLDLAKKILSSGHLDTKKILNKIETTGNYSIPDFEGVKVLLYGDYMNYDPCKSPFINFFDIQNKEATEHFIRLAILHYLDKIPTESSAQGYTNISEVYNYLSALGYSYKLAESEVGYLVQQNCIRRPIEGLIESDQNKKVRITSLGRYHIYSLIMVFQYFDAIIDDTPILDDKLRANIAQETEISKRVDRTKAFVEYLDVCSEQLQDKELKSVWHQISNTVKQDIDEIRNRIKRQNSHNSEVASFPKDLNNLQDRNH